jgi:hypothetical protein
VIASCLELDDAQSDCSLHDPDTRRMSLDEISERARGARCLPSGEHQRRARKLVIDAHQEPALIDWKQADTIAVVAELRRLAGCGAGLEQRAGGDATGV